MKWYDETAFGEPANMGGIVNGMGVGNDDHGIGIKNKRVSFPMISTDAKLIIAVWPFIVVFDDGSKWKL